MIKYQKKECITFAFPVQVDSVMRMEKKNYPQVYFEKHKYKSKKTKMTNFINTELESESEIESDTELESKSELESDTE